MSKKIAEGREGERERVAISKGETQRGTEDAEERDYERKMR